MQTLEQQRFHELTTSACLPATVTDNLPLYGQVFVCFAPVFGRFSGGAVTKLPARLAAS
jgi:hypothetical protein